MDEGAEKSLSERIGERVEKLTKCDCPKTKCLWCDKETFCSRHTDKDAACYDCSVSFIIEDEGIDEDFKSDFEKDWTCYYCQHVNTASDIYCQKCEYDTY